MGRIPIQIDERKMNEILENIKNDPAKGLEPLTEFLSVAVETNPRVQTLKKDTLDFANSHLQELLYEQKDLAFEHYGLPEDVEVCTEGVTYLTWPAQFKVSGITVVNMRKALKKEGRLNFDTDYAGIHHDCEYTIGKRYLVKRYAKRVTGPHFSEFPLTELPEKDGLIKMAKDKAIHYEIGC